MNVHNILLIDDDRMVFEDFEKSLKGAEDLALEWVSSGPAAIELIKKFPRRYSNVISDHLMPGMNGAETTIELLKINPDLIVATYSADKTREAVKLSQSSGALEFLDKGISDETLVKTLRGYCKKFEENFQVLEADNSASQHAEKIQTIGAIGLSAKLGETALIVEQAAGSDCNVVIYGETGTGKELLAKAIHNLSKRKSRAFIALNVATLSPELFESDLFGHVKGSFTGAVGDKVGKFKLAHGGTIFLDEITELSLPLQARLLRVIESGDFYPVGSNKPESVNVRIVVASNKELETAVKNGTFRSIENIRKAEEIEFQFERELAKLREEGSPHTWQEWFEIAIARMKRDLAASTVMNYQGYIGKWVSPHWKNRELKAIGRDDVYKVVFDTFDKTLSANSQRTLLKQIRRIFEMAVEDAVLDRNPAVGIKVHVPEIEQGVLTNEEVKIFLQMAKDTAHRFYPIWLMALMTGMRSGELYALNWLDIDLEARLISVSKQWTNKVGFGPTKSRRTRVVPISDELLLFLKEYKLKTQSTHVLPRHKEWENGEQALVTREFCQSIGIPEVKFHDLRATFITNLLARGVPLAVVMSMVGHSQIKTTNVYLRKAGVDIKGGTDKLGYGVPNAISAPILQLVR